MEAWQDMATIYTDLNSFLDAKACVDKAQLLEFFSPRSWHITGMEPEHCLVIFVIDDKPNVSAVHLFGLGITIY
jgi:hypothetical protein